MGIPQHLTGRSGSAITNGGTAGEAERDGTPLWDDLGSNQSDGEALLNLPAKDGRLERALSELAFELVRQLYEIPQPTDAIQQVMVALLVRLRSLHEVVAGSDGGASDA